MGKKDSTGHLKAEQTPSERPYPGAHDLLAGGMGYNRRDHRTAPGARLHFAGLQRSFNSVFILPS